MFTNNLDSEEEFELLGPQQIQDNNESYESGSDLSDTPENREAAKKQQDFLNHITEDK
jgi:hypothetical protein